jgi:hypothetical protein
VTERRRFEIADGIMTGFKIVKLALKLLALDKGFDLLGEVRKRAQNDGALVRCEKG